MGTVASLVPALLLLLLLAIAGRTPGEWGEQRDTSAALPKLEPQLLQFTWGVTDFLTVRYNHIQMWAKNAFPSQIETAGPFAILS